MTLTSAVWSAIISFVIIFFSTIVGIYLEDNETIVAAINYGVFGEMGNEQYWSDSLVFLFPVLFKISKLLPYIPVFGLFKLLTQFIAFWAISLIAIRNFYKNITYIIILVVAGCIFIYDSLFQLHCIRQSILLSFTSLYLHEMYYDNERKLSATSVLLFFFAVITRIHAAALILFAFILYSLLKRSPKYVFRKYWIMLAFTLILLGIYQLNGRFTDNMGRYIEAHFEYPILEKPHIAPLSLQSSSADTARYLGLKSFFFTDTAQFKRDYFHQFVRIQPTLSFILDSQNLIAIKHDIIKRWNDTSLHLILIIILIFIFFWASPSQASKTLLFTFVMFLVPAGLILILTNELKERFFNSYVGVLTWLVFLECLLIFQKHSLPKIVRYSLLVILVAGLGAFAARQIFYYNPLQVQLSHVHQEFLKNSMELSTKSNGESTLFFSDADMPLTNSPLYRTPHTIYRNFATFDGGYLTYYSYCVDRFTKLFGYHPGDFRGHVKLFTNSKQGILAYISKERIELIKNYFLHIYNIKLDFIKVSEIEFSKADLYRVKALKI